MIQMGSILEVADNTGAKKIACITVLGGSSGQYGGVGDVISASVKEASPDGTVKKGTVVKAVVVRTAKEIRRRLVTGKKEGQDLVEYALLAALLSIVSIAALQVLGPVIANVWTQISGAISGV